MRLSSGNPMGKVLMALLCFEAVVFALAIPGMISVSGVAPAVAVPVGVGAALVAVVSAAGMRRGFGYPLGWLTQVIAVGLGLLTSWMFALGGLFALLWIITFLLGRRLDDR